MEETVKNLAIPSLLRNFLTKYLIYLLEKLHEDLNRNKEKVYIELNEKGENETDIQACNRWWETHQKRDNSIINDLFSGQYKNTVRCPF